MDLNRQLPKTYKWPAVTWKGAEHYQSQGKCKSKPQWDATSRVLDSVTEKTRDDKCWWESGETGPLCPVGGNVQVQPLGKNVWSFHKIKTELPSDPAISYFCVCICVCVCMKKMKLEPEDIPSLLCSMQHYVCNSWDIETTHVSVNG